jgi:thiol-disulfide isomerase/thioredoxin
MLAVKLVVIAGAVGMAFLGLSLWRRAPRVSLIDPGAIGATGPAIVQFGTPDCGPCRRARPLLDRMAHDAGIQFVDVDLVERPDLAQRYRIRTVPLVLVTGADGTVLGRWTGIPPGEEVRRLAASARA